jgi:hypothetical protein
MKVTSCESSMPSSPVQATKKKLKVTSSTDSSVPSSSKTTTKLAPLGLLDPPSPPSNPHLLAPPSDFDYIRYLPEMIRTKVRDILYVRSDGHCVFQEVAYSMGRGQGNYMAV